MQFCALNQWLIEVKFVVEVVELEYHVCFDQRLRPSLAVGYSELLELKGEKWLAKALMEEEWVL